MPMSSIKVKEDDCGSVEPSTVAGISAFLGKLWKMVEDPKTDDLIAWGKSGNSFVIKNQIDFAKTILPNYYKHNNIASFIRQLNMYGFHKIISTSSGALDSVDNDEIEFTHPNFVRGRPYLLEQIKRKMNNPKENIAKNENGIQFNESIKRVLMDMKQLKGKQDNLSSQFCSVKQENEILWRELSLLRQKHAAQQSILNKLIRFLVSLAQPNHGMAKRRLVPVPLMLKDSARANNAKKQAPIIQESGDHMYTLKKRDSHSPGPTIHEIHSPDMIDDVIIDSPVMEVALDGQMLMENEIVDNPVPVTKPIPAALLRSDSQGKKRIQRVYISPEEQVSPHFLLSQPNVRGQRSSEYLIPEQTDNPLLELVHETEGENDNEYITILADDDTEMLNDSIPAAIIGDHPSDARSFSRSNNGRKKQPTPRKKLPMRKTNVVEPVTMKTAQMQKTRTTTGTKKKASIGASVENEKIDSNAVRSDDFLFDINLETEPLIEIHTPKPNPSSVGAEGMLPEYVSIGGTSPNSHLQIDIPMEEAICKISPTAESTKSINVDVSPSMLSPHSHVSPISPMNSHTPLSPIHSVPPISPLNPVTPISPMSPISPNMNRLSPNKGMNQTGLSPGEQPVSPQTVPENAFIDQINECIDDAQNMKIACTADTNISSSTKAYAENLSNQLEHMQADLNSLKELMQNEGLTLNVDTLLDLFNEDPLTYSMPTGDADSLYKPNEEKIMGNELISASPVLDFNDIFPNEWNQSNTPINIDDDYCSLNTPQIDRNVEESSLCFAPPQKKIKSRDETN